MNFFNPNLSPFLSSLVVLESLVLLVFYLIFIVLFILSDKISKNTYFIIIVLIKIKAVLVSESYLKQIVIQTFLRNSDSFGSFFKGVFLWTSVICCTCIIFSPFNNFINNVSDSSLFSPSAFVVLAHLLGCIIFLSLLVCISSNFKWHQSMNQRYSKITGFDYDCSIILEILWFDFDIFIQRVKPAIHEYIPFG